MKTIVNQISAVKTSLLICLMALAGSSFGQQLYYSQYQLTPMLNNPSLIGLSEELKVDVGYRNQFGGKGSNYGTPVVAAVMPFYKESVQNVFTKIGVGGIQVLTDRTGYSGLLATTGFSLTYAHMVNLSRKDKFSFGLQPGVYQRRVDFGKLESGSQWDAFNGSYDQGLPLNENIAQTERRTFFSINSGITYIRENEAGEPFLTLAVAANNMTRPNISLNDKSFSNPLYWNFQGSVVAYENEQFIVKPTARHIQAQNLNQTNIGSYVYYKIDQPKGFLSRGNIGLGAWYSNQNAVVLALEINQRDWALGFSYDFLTSSLADVRNSTGAPEIVVGFRKYLGKKKAPLPDMSGSKKSGGKDGGGELKEPKKVEPSKSEMTPEPAVKPADPKAGEENKPAVEREQTERKDEVKPVEPKPEPEPAEAAPTKPAEKPAKKEPAEKPAPKKAGAKGKKAVAQKNATPKSNLDPAMTEKMSKVRTSDADLGKDPYEGTPLALTKAQRDVFKKQPHYGKGGSELDQIAKDQLNAIAKMMKERPDMKLEIQGYGCDLGGPEITKVISLGRAESTRKYLISKGIPADRLETKAMGVEKPIGDNSTEENKIINRRVQFKFL